MQANFQDKNSVCPALFGRGWKGTGALFSLLPNSMELNYPGSNATPRHDISFNIWPLIFSFSAVRFLSDAQSA